MKPSRQHGSLPRWAEFALLAAVSALLLAGLPTPVRAQVYGHWSRLDSDVLPPGRRAAGAAYDSQRRRLIVFGGYPTFLNDVWALDLGTEIWQAIVPAGAPPSPRYGASAIYDSAGDRLIVFGGFDGAVQRQDVWQLTLAGSPTWTLLAPTGTPPPGRSFHMAAYDAPRRRMILFGGFDGSGFLGDTWELSLAGAPAWSAMSFAHPTPAPRNIAGIAVDTDTDRLVLFGGWSGSYRNDTWTLSLSGAPVWSNLVTATRPAPRREISMTHDPAHRRIVLFGGNDGALRSDTWALDLAGVPDWLAVSPGAAPDARYGHNTIYDPVGDRVVIFGGLELGGHSPRAWALDAGHSRWSEVAFMLPNLRNYSLARDPVANRVLIFGGESPSPYRLRNDLFAMDLGADRWSRVEPANTAPSPRYAPRAVWDPVRDRMLVFGGYDGAYLNDLWEYRPRPTPTWIQLFPAGIPPAPRFAGGLVFDAARDRLVAFGGYRTEPHPIALESHLPIAMNDLWILPLSGPGAMTWAEETPLGGPPSARWGQVMLMDEARDRALVFGGGASAESGTAELFALDLAAAPPAWSPISLPPGPPGRILHAGVLDPQENLLVVFGGYTNDPPGARFLGDLWTIPLSAGASGWWEVPTSPPAPVPRNSSGAIHDPVGRRIIVPAGFGGSQGYRHDTWALSWDHPVPTLASLVQLHAEPGRVRLEWLVRDAGSVRGVIERRLRGGAWEPLGAARPSGADRLAYEDLSVSAGARYGYRLDLRSSGGALVTDEVLVEVPASPRLELSGSWPNPGTGDPLTISFGLARSGDVRLEIVDLAGRRIASRDLGTLEPGGHRIRMDGIRLEPGLYLVRLAAEGRMLTARAIVLR